MVYEYNTHNHWASELVNCMEFKITMKQGLLEIVYFLLQVRAV